MIFSVYMEILIEFQEYGRGKNFARRKKKLFKVLCLSRAAQNLSRLPPV